MDNEFTQLLSKLSIPEKQALVSFLRALKDSEGNLRHHPSLLPLVRDKTE